MYHQVWTTATTASYRIAADPKLSVDGSTLFVMSTDDHVYAMRTKDGRLLLVMLRCNC